MHAEVIFETGSKSVLGNVSEEEVKAFVLEHQRRAMSGDVGGPTGHPAERVKKVLLYDDHPGLAGEDGSVDASRISTLVEGMASNGRLDGWQLIAAIRDEMSPLYPQDQGRHQSLYKTEAASELDLSFMDEAGA